MTTKLMCGGARNETQYSTSLILILYNTLVSAMCELPEFWIPHLENRNNNAILCLQVHGACPINVRV